MVPLNLSVGQSSVSVKVQPAVLLNICDAYIRRSSKQNRVVGTLLGYFAEGALEIKNCYAVPHQHTTESIDFDIPQHHGMKELYLRVNPKEVVVGWFTTGTGDQLGHRDVLVQEFYESECQNPVILSMDTTLQNERLEISAFVSRRLTLKDSAPLATEFRPVDCEVRGVELENVGGDFLDEMSEKPHADVDQLMLAVQRLQDALHKATKYVGAVVDGTCKGDPRIGRFLADTVTAVPRIESTELERLVADNAQDALLILYLANLVRTQLALADRLGTAALPLL